MSSLHLHIDAGAAGTPISPRLFGLFYEDLNHAGEGGLYAELVENRAFNHPNPLTGWSMCTEGAGEGTMGPAYTPAVNPVNPWGLRLRILSTGARVGVTNGGYWGIPVQEGRRYRLTLDAWRSEEFAGPLTATLESAAGEILAQETVPALLTACQRQTVMLAAHGTDPQARLVLAAETPGTVWFDFVSLFPEDTWHGRTNGLRPDLAAMMAALQPSFMRFPGGCYVEGDRLEEAFRWKENLGDLARRKGHWNRWGYFSTGGLGLHEYLQLCEDLGAEPLFVVNAGMSHTDVVPEEQLDQWIQDAVDAIEYANGPLDSPWGAQRAEAGHPEPFNLRVIEIGNENGGPRYHANYPRYVRAITTRFPEVRIIANVPVPGEPVELIDEHYFESVPGFARRVRQYDGYDRQGPKIYVGEYACIQGSGLGNLRGALAEAMFMTGLERNGDIVEMASYAPLFVNVRDRHWELDAIGFDATRVYGTPSYYVQQLFSRYRVAAVLPCAVENAPTLPEADDAPGLVAVAGRQEHGEIILKVVNLTPTPQPATITLAGVEQVHADALTITLTADDPLAENSLTHPTNVIPVAGSTPMSVESSYMFPGYSLTMISMP